LTKRVPPLLAIFLLGSLLAGVAGAQGGRIVYSGTVGGSFDLLAIDPDGTDLVNLTAGPDHEWDPAISPDGTGIAFSRRLAGLNSSDIWVMDADGTRQRRLIREAGGPYDRDPAWSPDGQRIAWTRSTGGPQTSQIWVMRADGRLKRPLTDDERGIYDHSPAWSPDGQRIAFVSNRGRGFPDIWVMNLTTGIERRLTDTEGLIEGKPAWSPDGRQIAYECRAPLLPTAICLMSASGLSSSRLTLTDGFEAQPAWSPDGSYLAYTRAPAGGGDKDLVVMQANGQAPAVITSSNRLEFDAAWGLWPASMATVSAPRLASTGGVTSPSVGTQSLVPKQTKRVAPGVTFMRFRYERSDLFVVKIKPHLKPTIDVVLGHGELAGRERVTAVARRRNAVAAINGDFPLPSGRPSMPFAEDGDLKTTSFGHSDNFGIRRDESHAYVDHAREILTVREHGSGDVWPFERWNRGAPTAAEMAAFSPPGGTEEQPPKYACSARLMPVGGRRWMPQRRGIIRPFEVDVARCSSKRMDRLGGVVLAAQPATDGAFLLDTLRPREDVAVSWLFHGWTGVVDSIGGWPVLLDHGAIVAEDCISQFCSRHPRTGIGVMGASKVLMVVADGRSSRSAGLTLVQFARFFKAVGARDAVNFDGGGSSIMVIRGKIRNEPADDRERPVCCTVLVLPGGDRHERIKPPSSSSTALGAQAGGGGRWSLLDPGSTGGMLDAMSRGAFGADPSTLTAEMWSAVRAYRRAA
jgi:Tol biopolymer transport system component